MVLLSPSKGNSFARRSSLVPLPPEMRWHVTWSCLTYLVLGLCHLKVMGDRIMLSRNISGLVPLPPESFPVIFLVWCVCHLKVAQNARTLNKYLFIAQPTTCAIIIVQFQVPLEVDLDSLLVVYKIKMLGGNVNVEVFSFIKKSYLCIWHMIK